MRYLEKVQCVCAGEWLGRNERKKSIPPQLSFFLATHQHTHTLNFFEVPHYSVRTVALVIYGVLFIVLAFAHSYELVDSIVVPSWVVDWDTECVNLQNGEQQNGEKKWKILHLLENLQFLMGVNGKVFFGWGHN